MKNWNWDNAFTYTNSSGDEIIDSSGISMQICFIIVMDSTQMLLDGP